MMSVVTRWSFAVTTLVLLVVQASAFADERSAAILRQFRAEFIELTPGSDLHPATFSMGRMDGGASNERPVRTIQMQTPFSIGRYEVTQELWETIMGSNPSRWKGPRNSVEMVSHPEAVSFCAAVTRALRDAELIGADEEVRLPSEAEWEYAARAGTTTVYSFGDLADRLDNFAWHAGNAAGNDPPVGAKQPNAWGLYDVHGYLWEWCADTYATQLSLHPNDGSPYRLTAPAPDTTSTSNTTTDLPEADTRVVRGGSWKDGAPQLTSSVRRAVRADLRDDAVGLRCVLSKVRPVEVPAKKP